jgi:hypothetical protein
MPSSSQDHIWQHFYKTNDKYLSNGSRKAAWCLYCTDKEVSILEAEQVSRQHYSAVELGEPLPEIMDKETIWTTKGKYQYIIVKYV